MDEGDAALVDLDDVGGGGVGVSGYGSGSRGGDGRDRKASRRHKVIAACTGAVVTSLTSECFLILGARD